MRFLVFFKKEGKEKKLNIESDSMEDAVLLGRVKSKLPITHVKRVGSKHKVTVKSDVIGKFVTGGSVTETMEEKHIKDTLKLINTSKELGKELGKVKRNKILGIF